ncbi:hypothetical protein ACFSJY_16610 [Thalassotalea euphylliae]|uniref:hypothetical protein n=1 Tax=Thalassotalea euphylliae TaxID=1655234 RepID=UPI0036411166
MKKLGIIAFSVMLAACASAPSWKGMSESEIAAWKDMGVTVEQVGAYVKAGLSHPQVQEWLTNGFTEQKSILAWSGANFKPEQAASWRDVNFNLEDAMAWAAEKFTPADAKAWRDGGFELEDALDNREKGLQPVK